MTLPAFASVEAESVDDTVAGLAAAGGADPCHRGRNRAGAVDESSVDPPAVLAGVLREPGSPAFEDMRRSPSR
jgi:hypothetical protein